VNRHRRHPALRRGAAIAGALALLALGAVAARAESAYVLQAPAGSAVDPALDLQRVTASTRALFHHARTRTALAPSPETAVPAGHGNNLAQTLQIGAYNQVMQVQAGAGDSSFVGIVAGAYNNVGVWQAGNNLRSNLVLLNTVGLNVGVLQPRGSAPVNVLVARLPGGGLLIKR